MGIKIAIFHNYMDNIGGAEIVSLILSRELNAEIFTTNIDVIKIKKMGFNDVIPRIHSIGRVPLNAPFRQQITSQLFRKLNLSNSYGCFIIAGDWAVSAAKNHHPNVWYVHSPIREIWDLYDYTREYTVPRVLRPFFDIWVKINRYLNRNDVKNVDKIVCNSQNTRKRVSKYLNRDSIVIYPPIDTSQFKYKSNKGYWLSVSRLISHKRIDILVKAFQKLKNSRLVIIGSYEKSRHFINYANHIKSIKPKNVIIKSWLDREELLKVYSECTGVVLTSKDEDFGMVPVEAMASGKPVIAPNEGGYLETIINGKTGILISKIDEQNLVESIIRVEREIQKNPNKYITSCIKQAQKFDKNVFIRKMKEQLKK